jgi:hypothetical protein
MRADVGVAEQPHLTRHGLEDRVGGDPVGDQRRHSPQRRLLVREPPLRGRASRASCERAAASWARTCARRASSLTTYAVPSAISSAAPVSGSSIAKLWRGRTEKELEREK